MTPLQPQEWAGLLVNHPDTAWVDYLLRGMLHGFRIGFNPTQALRAARANMPSACQHAEVVQEYIDAELKRGRLLGPFEPSEVGCGVQVNRFGVIPKRQHDKWRLIVDLSHPEGGSVNDGIDPELCSLSYTRVDDVARRIRQLGVGAEMAKVDIKSAYRIVPVHPQDRLLLGMKWEGKLYLDPVLPFGLRSAPKIFNAIADALEWIFKANGASEMWHYLDDFIMAGEPGTGECDFNLQLVHHL